MKIINVVEIIGGVLSSIESFPILEDNTTLDKHFFSTEEGIEKAEELFARKVKENNILSEQELLYCIEEGVYDDNNGYEVLIHWSGINVNE